ncbi:MAG: GDP-mannose-dependent alpha-mannosyltransferase [Anaerolineae bacterium]|nr:GDP-mannose-dependent alpha-mannosyltransferase [Anaerolineae bacterium]
MRIAFFTETFLPKIDGIVNTLTYLLDYLARRGHQSILFAPQGGPMRYAKTPVIGLPGLPFPLYPELKLVSPHINVSRMLNAFQPDLIHVVNPFSLGIIGLKHAKTLGIPLVASYHTDIPGFVSRWGFGMLEEPFWRYLRWLHQDADLNLCPSTVTQAELDRQGFAHTKVWSRGVDTERFAPKHYAECWRRRLCAHHPSAPLLLYVGRLSPEKRIDWLRPVLDEIPGLNLAIVGDGPARADLEKLFANTATVFTGYLRHHQLAQAYATADIFVFPAANETLGNVVLEAMASGLPVVAARSGGVLDHVIENETGLFFDPETPASLVTVVNRLVQNEQLAHKLGIGGRLAAEQKTWEHVFDGLLHDYAAVARRRVPAFSLVALGARNRL